MPRAHCVRRRTGPKISETKMLACLSPVVIVVFLPPVRWLFSPCMLMMSATRSFVDVVEFHLGNSSQVKKQRMSHVDRFWSGSFGMTLKGNRRANNHLATVEVVLDRHNNHSKQRWFDVNFRQMARIKSGSFLRTALLRRCTKLASGCKGPS